MIGEQYVQQYLTYWHGRGEPEQHDYYRCKGCRRIVTWHAIHRGGCLCSGLSHVVPARLSRWEKVRLILLPWWRVVR